MEAHGMPCSECVHLRRGASVASGVFLAMLPSVRPAANKFYTDQMKSETDAQGTFWQLREGYKSSGNELYGRRPTHRDAQYCGWSEFANEYRLNELKNANLDCPDFQLRPEDSGSHTCDTCAHNARPSSRVRVELERLLVQSDDLKTRIKERLDSQVELEYTQAVFGQGFVLQEPAFLPVCRAWSTDGQYVVGPVVNIGGACGHWVHGAAEDDVDARLDELLAAIAEAERAKRSHPLLQNRAPDGQELVWIFWLGLPVRRAKKDLIRYCLARMQMPDDFITEIEETFASGEAPYEPDEVVERRFAEAVGWFTQSFGHPPAGLPAEAESATTGRRGRVDSAPTSARATGVTPPRAPTSVATRDGEGSGQIRTSSSGPGLLEILFGRKDEPAASDQTAAAEQVAARDEPAARDEAAANDKPPADAAPGNPMGDQFLVAPNREYRHPGRGGVTLKIEVGQYQTVVRVRVGEATHAFDLFSFPPLSWSQVQGPAGPLPLVLRNELPAAVYALWLE